MSLQPGEVIDGKYRIVRLVGEGGMGSVYEGENTRIKRRVAIKVLHSAVAEKKDVVQRFEREAQAAGRIGSEHIVEVLDLGTLPSNERFMVMEFLDGMSLSRLMRQQKGMRIEDAVDLVMQALEGVAEAHARGIVHRDLKPSNLFLVGEPPRRTVKVLDFGISKAGPQDDGLTATGEILGSPRFMAPEQMRKAKDVDARTDIWALGVILYESLAGELPFDANNYNALMLAIITQPHRPLNELAPEVPPQLSALVDQLLEKDRTKRVSSAGELAQRLERVYATMTSTPMSLPERPASIAPLTGTMTQQGWLRGTQRNGGARRVSPVMLVGAVAVLGLIGGGVPLRSARADVRVAPASRMGATVNAIAARADAAFTEAAANAKAADAEERIKQANERADNAEKEKKARKSTPSKGQSKPGAVKKPASSTKSDPHGGVGLPGF